ncbi:putative ribonuclease H-like domain-containing protein, partial [Tanacetum coccineum]
VGVHYGIRILPPVTAVEIQAVEKERKTKNILLMAIPKEHIRRFHGMDDAKEIWEAIRTRRVRVDGKAPVGFDKKKLECFNCHNTGHFVRECTAKGTHDGKKKRDSFYQHQEAGNQEKNQMSLLTMDDGIVNWGANEIYEKDEKLKRYRRIGMKAVKEKEQLQKTLDSWKDSSKNLWRLINSGMSSNNKLGLGYEIQSNNEGPQEPEPSVSDDRSSEYSTCQSNDSAGSIGTSSEITRTPLQIVDLNLRFQEYLQKCTNQVKKHLQLNRTNWNGYDGKRTRGRLLFTKKKCFVCGSLSHLIKDCDYYEKKMAREAEVKKQRVFNTGHMMAKPVWTNTDRINHANQFVPRPVQLNTGRSNINSVRTNINSGKRNINYVRPRVNTINSNVNTVRSRQPIPTKTSRSFSPKRPQDHPLKNMVDRGKQHRASCKAKLERLITEPLHTLHMDLFGPTSVKSINHASYCLVITDDCTRFSWVFFLASKDETSGILQNFIRQIENQLSHRVKIIRSDNGNCFKNRDMLEFCGNKGIKQEYSNARTPQQNGVAERMNRTLIEAARTMLADSLLPTTF